MDTAQIYTGRWTDWSEGRILGDRVTLSIRNAGTLTAFIAIFDAYVGGMAWSLLAFYMHRWSATSEAKDGMYQQLQTLLRNSAEPLSFTWRTLRVGYSWRGRVRRPILRALATVILPVAVSVLFAVAGIFSSRIAISGNVLLVGGDCGMAVNDNPDATVEEIAHFNLALNAQVGINAALSNAYAQNCYSNPLYSLPAELAGEYAPGANCATFAKQTLNYTATLGAACPFEEACSVPDSQVITLDTGWLNSHDDLGLNQPPENRILFRKWNTCSPMKTEGYSSNAFHKVQGFESLGGIATYNYGVNYGQPSHWNYPDGLPGPNTTFVYSEAQFVGSPDSYQLIAASNMNYGAEGYVFIPMPSIAKDSYTPMSLFFLGNRGSYQQEVEDPWFRANTSYTASVTVQDPYGNVVTKNETFWRQAEPGTVLGCVEDLLFCNPNVADFHNACTESNQWYRMTGFPAYYTDPTPFEVFTNPFPKGMGLNPIQMSTMMALQTAMLNSQTWGIVGQLGRQGLLANNLLFAPTESLSSPLPANQWQIEVTNWFSIALSGVQHQFISNWRKPNVPGYSAFWRYFKPTDTAEQDICSSQMVKGSAYQSFYVLALAVNFAIGIAIILASLILTTWIPYLTRHKPASIRRAQWNAHGVLQIQRRLYESEGCGIWDEDSSSVPVAAKGELFGTAGLKSSEKRGSMLTSLDAAHGTTDADAQRSDFIHPTNPAYGNSENYSYYPKTPMHVATTDIDGDTAYAPSPMHPVLQSRFGDSTSNWAKSLAGSLRRASGRHDRDFF